MYPTSSRLLALSHYAIVPSLLHCPAILALQKGVSSCCAPFQVCHQVGRVQGGSWRPVAAHTPGQTRGGEVPTSCSRNTGLDGSVLGAPRDSHWLHCSCLFDVGLSPLLPADLLW